MTNGKTLRNKLALTVATLGVACSLGGTLSHVNTDTYYGNGLYCNKHKCYVDWGKAWVNIANNSAANWLTGGQAGWHD